MRYSIVVVLILLTATLAAPPKRTNYSCKYPSNYENNLQYGPEDTVRITDDIYIISQADRIQQVTEPNGPFAFNPQNPPTKGGFHFYNFQTDKVQMINIKNWPNGRNLQPFGSYFEESSDLLYTINDLYSGEEGTSFEEFKVDYSDSNNVQLTFVRTFTTDNEKHSGIFNGMIKVAPGQIIATKFAYPVPADGNQEGAEISSYLSFLSYSGKLAPVGNLQLCTFNESQMSSQQANCQTLPGTENPLNNGLNWNRKDIIIVANTVNQYNTVYHLDLSGSQATVKKIQTVNANGSPDNIDYDPKTDTFTSAGVTDETKLSDFMLMPLAQKRTYVQNTYNKQVLSYVDTLTVHSNYSTTAQNKYYQESLINGQSTGLINGNKLFIGTWFDKSIIVCTENSSFLQ